jgi:hypothetical protein
MSSIDWFKERPWVVPFSLSRFGRCAPFTLGTHQLPEPKCQKFEKIPMRCQKISGSERSVDFAWGYGSRFCARFGFKFGSRVID